MRTSTVKLFEYSSNEKDKTCCILTRTRLLSRRIIDFLHLPPQHLMVRKENMGWMSPSLRLCPGQISSRAYRSNFTASARA